MAQRLALSVDQALVVGVAWRILHLDVPASSFRLEVPSSPWSAGLEVCLPGEDSVTVLS